MRIAKDEGKPLKLITPLDVHALMLLQNKRCTVSGVDFVFPTHPLPMHTTLEQWADTEELHPAKRLWLPTLVRAYPTSGFEPGNIVLIARAFHPMSRALPCIADVRTLLNKRSTVSIPTKREITLMHQSLLEHTGTKEE